MKKYTTIFVVLAVLVIAGFAIGDYFADKTEVAKQPAVTPAVPVPVMPVDDASTTPTVSYANPKMKFSLQVPTGYTTDASYKYQELGPGKSIAGVKFTIDPAMAAGTNLSPDSYVSVEEIPHLASCSAAAFLDQGATIQSVGEHGYNYSVGVLNGAGAGNRYDETVYAVVGSSPCIAMRYYIHYSAFENYPAGAVTQFKEDDLISDFDQIRKTLTITK